MIDIFSALSQSDFPSHSVSELLKNKNVFCQAVFCGFVSCWGGYATKMFDLAETKPSHYCITSSDNVTFDPIQTKPPNFVVDLSGNWILITEMYYVFVVATDAFSNFISHIYLDSRFGWRSNLFDLYLQTETSHFLKTHIIGVICHGQNKVTWFLDLLQWKHYSNLTMNILLQVFTEPNKENFFILSNENRIAKPYLLITN